MNEIEKARLYAEAFALLDQMETILLSVERRCIAATQRQAA